MDVTKKTTLNSSVAFRLSEADFGQLLIDSAKVNLKPSEFARQWLLTRQQTLEEISELQRQIEVLVAENAKTEQQFALFRRATFSVLALLIVLAGVTLSVMVWLPEPTSRKNEAVFRREGVRP
jgi:hypothetical protein